MILSDKRIAKALIRLCGCICWSAPLLFANSRRQVFSRRGQFKVVKARQGKYQIAPSKAVVEVERPVYGL